MGRYSTVLVSRPQPQADELAAALQRSGIPTLVSPALRFEAAPGPVAMPALAVSESPLLLVFTSPRAVTFGLQALSLDKLDHASVAAIGPATAAALEQAGQKPMAVAGGHHTSEDLLSDPLLADRPGVAFIVTAPGGRGQLAPGLRRLGWQVQQLDVYRRVPVAPSPRVQEQIAGSGPMISTWTSGKAMDTIIRGLGPEALSALQSGLFIVASPRLATLAGDHGAGRVTVAESAGNADLQTAVESAWRELPPASTT